jgi:hypothetical protein
MNTDIGNEGTRSFDRVPSLVLVKVACYLATMILLVIALPSTRSRQR